MPSNQADYYEEAIKQIISLSIRLYGGYYEPKSDRDARLAGKLWDLVVEEAKENNKDI